MVKTKAFNEVKPEVQTAKTHRYFCDACTGVAFHHRLGDPLPNQVTCPNCGTVLSDLKETNLIAL